MVSEANFVVRHKWMWIQFEKYDYINKHALVCRYFISIYFTLQSNYLPTSQLILMMIAMLEILEMT